MEDKQCPPVGAADEDCMSESSDCLSVAKTSFVRKLFDLVSQESDEIVAFAEDGSAFEVKNPKRLELEVLPKYFRHSRFQSLVRQLNFYNFKKISKERHMWVYHHECFHRDKPALLENLKRKTSQSGGSGSRASSPSSMRRSVPMPSLGSSGAQGNVEVWREVFDESTGQIYYWNVFTGSSQWDPPSSLEPEEPHQRNSSLRDRLSQFGSSSLPMSGFLADDEATSEESGDPTTSPRFSGPSRKMDLSSRPAAKRQRQENGSSRGTGGSQSDGTDDESWSLDSYFSEDQEKQPLPDELVSPEVLGALQRALYERRTSPALVALVTFGLRTAPHQKPSTLLSSVKEKLSSHSELWNELRKYREALEPKTPCYHQHSGSMYSEQHGWAFSPLSCGAENDMCMMREFMPFIVTRLQAVKDHCDRSEKPLDAEHQLLLTGCLKTWWGHASRFL
mmetsp:Transcript_723/g.2318  ORF Transcript_723/g.2318 Transcript_723/m.2318 type:complete len:449 (-) Transcript_723:274-1620(-)